MRVLKLATAFTLLFVIAAASPTQGQTTSPADAPTSVKRERDVIYHKTEGVALTMDVFTPKHANGAAVVKILSGGWKSNHKRLHDEFSKPYTDHGYTVFAVVHGSQPRYKVREIESFLHRAIRFIRTNADRWNIQPNKIGVTGSSAGGHLSLLLATKGKREAKKTLDKVDRASSRVQAAAVFYPPTDYLNWSKPGEIAVGIGRQEPWKKAFGPEADSAEGRAALGKFMSPIYHLSSKTAPTLIVHGDSDKIVPLFQSTSYQEAAAEKGALVHLVVKPGGGHGWPNKIADEAQFVSWFDKQLLGKTSSETPAATIELKSVPDSLLGDWSLNLDSKLPTWMRVAVENGQPKVYWREYVGGKGPYRISSLHDGRVKFRVVKKKKKQPTGAVTEVEFGMSDGKLDGTIVRKKADGSLEKESFSGQKISTMPSQAPDLSKVKFGDRVVLFNGKDMTGWTPHEPEKINGWSVANGELINTTPKTDFSATGDHANLKTVGKFKDFHLHIEFYVEENCNSGVYVRGMYEAQVVDRDSRMQGKSGVGAIYGTIEPSVNAGKPGGHWQTYDITLVDRHFTVVLNGQKVIDNQPVSVPTAGAILTNPDLPGPIYLQGDHTNVKYRNIYLEPVLEN